MKPQFSITSNGQDITSQISDRLLSFTVKDEAGIKSDTFSISLDDKDQNLSLPKTSTKLEIKIGYSDLISLGTFYVDEVGVSYPPAKVTVRGKAMSNSLKSKKTRSWDEQTISQIVETIALEHGLTARVGNEFANKKPEHVDQTDESDAHFLSRLAGEYGAVAKPAGENYLFIQQGEGKTASGQTLKTVEVKLEECTSYSCTQSERGNYDKIVTKYQDKEDGKEKTVEHEIDNAAQESVTHRVGKIYPSKEEAENAASSMAKDLAAGTTEISLTIVGRADIFAESPITLSGFRSDPMDGVDWTIHSVTHTFSNRGYITQISCSNKPVESTTETVN